MAARNLARSVQRVYSNPFRLMFSSKFQQQDEGACRLNCVCQAGKSFDVPSRCETSPFLDKASESSTAGFHFPSLRSAIEDHGFYCDVNRISPRPIPPLVWDGQLQTNMHRLGMGSSLFLYEKELQYHDAIPGQLCWITNSNYLPTTAEVDEVSLPSQNESTNSPMLMNTKRTFNPSTLVRKRRHGFLARKSTVGGRRVLARRFLKGRRRLSA